MDCYEAVYSENYFDIMVNESDTIPGVDEICRQPISNRYVVYYLSRDYFPPLSVGAYKYTNIPKCYTLLDQSSLEASGITRVQTLRNIELKGRGILIGFLDTGINYELEAFRNTDGSSRIAAIWDQSIDSPDRHPQGFIYGSEYTREDINEALSQEIPRDYVPQTDEVGHGTRLAAIAAGSEDVANDFIGAAPYADIAMVKLKPAKQYLRDFYHIRDGAHAYQENDIFAAIAYLHQLAASLGQPLALCIGLGTNQGNHGGSSRLTYYLDSISGMYRRAICIAVGSEANARHHFYGCVNDDTSQKVEINVTQDSKGLIVELWSRASELYSVSITSPTGEVLPRVPVWNGQQQRHRFLLENTSVVIDYQLGAALSREQLIYIDFSNLVMGIWTIEVYPYRISQGNFNMFLPITDFLEHEVYFVRSNPDTTLTMPSSASLPMAVAGYNAVTESIYLESGRGYAMSGEIKPDFAAPAVDVYTVNQFGRYDRMTGTSAAAAIATGACALMLEWNLDYMNNPLVNSVELKNQIINGARKMPNQLYPNREEGYGRIDIYQSILNMRNL